ncbi:MAG: GNAT family N-acetyltransferase [Chloroflexia bacterium]
MRSREGGLVGFDLRTPEESSRAESPLPFPYNLENAVGAAAASLAAGAAEAGIREGLRRFRGVARRFERKGEAGGVVVYDDYAHHPAAVEAVLRAARDLFPAERIEVAFQPHTYSRTRAMLPEFAAALRLADRAYVLDVYAAREATDPSVAGDVLARLVGESAVYVGGVAGPASVCRMFSRDPGTVLVTMGAGDVTELGPLVLRTLGGAEGTEAG